jgi:hypothetical protein
MDDFPVCIDVDDPPTAIFENKCEVLVLEVPALEFIQPKNEARSPFQTWDPWVSWARLMEFPVDIQNV